MGLAPEAGRFFFYWFMLFWFHQFAVALFRLMGAALRPLTLANAGSVFFSMGVMTFGARKASRCGINLMTHFEKFLTQEDSRLSAPSVSSLIRRAACMQCSEHVCPCTL